MAEIGEYDIIAELQAYLSDALGVPVSSELPPVLPKEFVTIKRTGGVRVGIRNDTPQVAVRVYSDTEVNAWELAKRIRRAMFELPSLTPDVLRVAESSVSVSNPESKAHRGYFLLFFLTTTI